MYIDFHSHVLPGIDDGASDIPTSIEILNQEISCNTDIVLATPHYYPSEQSIEKFLTARNKAYDSLKNEISDQNYPDIKLGAEVYFSPLLINMDNLNDLCIENTNYMLLELPYSELTNRIINEIEKLIYSVDINFIIAHVERYLNFTSYDSIKTIMNMDVLGQINSSSVTDRSSRKDVIKLINSNYIHVIGSDVHNTTSRKVTLKDAEKILYKKVSKTIYSEFMDNALAILNNKDIDSFL